MMTAKRILVPVDFSEQSDLALEWAVKIARGNSLARIELLHVMPEVFAPIGPEAVAFDYGRLEAAEKASAESQMRRMQEVIPTGMTSDYTVVKGAVSTEIARVCGEREIDLVLMTTRGRRGLTRFIEGSTTEETVRLAPCPVLVLHLNDATRRLAKAS